MKLFVKLWNIVTTVLVTAAVLLALALAGVRLVGLTPYVVLSGSMEPGDPITFVLNEQLTVATHRVISIDAENQHFYTQGDANPAPDGAPVHFNNLIGRPVFCVPKLGYVSDYLSRAPGKYVGWTAAAVLLIALFAPDLLRLAGKADEKVAAGRTQSGGKPNGME